MTKTVSGNTGRFCLCKHGVVTVSTYNSGVKQLVLELIPAPRPSFDNFVIGRNIESQNAIFCAASQAYAVKVLYLWGVSGSGKSHLLSAAAANAGVELGLESSGNILVVDNVQLLGDAAQIALFNAINERANIAQSCVIAAGNVAPRDLPLRPELSSRLGSGLVFQLYPLSDDEKAAALTAHAKARGFGLRDEVIGHLLRYSRRDMASLIAMLDALDHFSLETGREITLPLLRQMSQPSFLASN